MWVLRQVSTNYQHMLEAEDRFLGVKVSCYNLGAVVIKGVIKYMYLHCPTRWPILHHHYPPNTLRLLSLGWRIPKELVKIPSNGEDSFISSPVTFKTVCPSFTSLVQISARNVLLILAWTPYLLSYIKMFPRMFLSALF